MPENSWRESDPSDPLEPVNSLLSDLSEVLLDPEADRVHPFNRGFVNRRRKAAIALTAIWGGTAALHLLSIGVWLVLGLTTVMGLHVLRLVLARPRPAVEPIHSSNPEDYPHISLLVAAKNEEAVIPALVENLANLDYPADRYDLWVIDDASSDRTPALLDRLTQTYPRLRVVHRLPNAGGGKSGALNQVWTQTRGEIIGVFDADAQVPADALRQIVPLFQREAVGAVQVRKAIANAPTNLWTRGQAAEMSLDAYFQQQRIAIGGVGELRGNGQFVRRSALKRCGGWNEETITDDLDLTIRLHLDRWEIDFLMQPPVQEEGVTQAIGLWHQRNRWAEGGYQRYLDYWRLIVRNRLGVVKTIDLAMFWLIQYVLPTASLPDLLLAIARNSSPMLLPVTSLTLLLSLVGTWIGVRRSQSGTASMPKSLPLQMATSLFGTVYMLHWLPVMIGTTARMSARSKRLKWVKTVHRGSAEV